MHSSIKPERANRNTDSTLSTSSPANTTRPASWRSWLRVHPAAEKFRLLSETDPVAFKELVEDIKNHGQREPVSYIRDSNGNPVLLDGQNRLDAREAGGKDIVLNDAGTFQQLRSDIDAYAFVISKNIHRRHLSAEDKRDLIGQLLEANPNQSDRRAAALVKTDHKTVAAVRREKERRGEIPHVETRTDIKGRKQSAKKASPHIQQPLKLHTQTLIDRWDFATPEEQMALIKSRWIDILRLHQKLEAAQNQLWTPEQPDNGLDIPAASLLRAPPGDRR